MTERKLEIPTIALKPGEPRPPGATIIEAQADGFIVIQQPIKYLKATDANGKIIDWERRPREDFV